MQIIYFAIIGLVFFACSVDSEDPVDDQDVQQDTDSSDTSDVGSCNPLRGKPCPCDPDIYNGDPLKGSVYVCCVGETQGYVCGGTTWTSQSYDFGDRCPQEAPVCPWPI
jgi:hypothetical protein